MPTRHIVKWSGGITSAEVALRVKEQHGTDNLVLLFADTKAEHPDLHRFSAEAAAYIGVPVTTVCDGRTPIEANRDRKFLGNSRLAHCSELLKQVPCRNWLKANSDPSTDILYVGLDWTEPQRMPAVVSGWAPWRVAFPLNDAPYIDKRNVIEQWRERGVAEPEMYQRGYPHNNCHGGCVKGGVAYWAHTLKTYPEVYAEHEQAEGEFRTGTGGTATYLTETRDGVKRALPLVQLRQRVEAHDGDEPGLFDPYDWGGCGCFVDQAA